MKLSFHYSSFLLTASDSCVVFSNTSLLIFSVALKMNAQYVPNVLGFFLFFFQNKAEEMIWRHWVICLCTSFEVAYPGRA